MSKLITKYLFMCPLREELFNTIIQKCASFTAMSNSEKFVFLLKN